MAPVEMAPMLQTALVFLSALNAASAGFVPAPTDLTSTTGYYNTSVRYKQVPGGICELAPGVKSYSGYVDIAEHEHIFWWFFEARDVDPTTAPLTVWINGGPGSSSMLGLFQENGPCRLDEAGNVHLNPYSWNNVSNMLYIDQPAQTGLSYSIPVSGYPAITGLIVELPEDECPHYAHDCGTYSYPSALYTANSTKAAAPGMWTTLQGFMGAFPQYSRSGFHFTTESYGGHYGPVFNEYIESQNALITAGKLPHAHKISLESVMIGNGWYDPLIQYAAYYNYSVSPGNSYDVTYSSDRIKNKMYNSMYGPGNCYDMTVACYTTGRNDVCSMSDNFCAYEVEEVLDVYLKRSEYDIRELDPSPYPPDFFEAYLNTPRVQKAIGAFVNYTSNNIVNTAFATHGDDDRTEGAVKSTKELIKQGVYVVQYNGDADYNCNWLGNQAVVAELDPPGLTSAGFTNISTTDGVVHGQVKQSDTFAFARIYESGHEVPFYQPVVALEMFERVINGYDVATGKTKIKQGGGFKTSGPSVSTYHEGNSTVQTKVVPVGVPYNTTLNGPNPFNSSTKRSAGRLGKRSKKHFKPSRRMARLDYEARFDSI